MLPDAELHKLLKTLKAGKSGECVAHLLYGRGGKVLWRTSAAVTQAVNRLVNRGLVQPDVPTTSGNWPTLTTAARALLFGAADGSEWDVIGWMLIGADTYRAAYHLARDGSGPVWLTPDLAAWLGWLNRHTHDLRTGPYRRYDNLHRTLHFVLSTYPWATSNWEALKSPPRTVRDAPDFDVHRWVVAEFERIARRVAGSAFAGWNDYMVSPDGTSEARPRRQLFVAVCENHVVNPARRVKPIAIVREGPRRAALALADFLERPAMVDDALALSDLITTGG